jgi:hypothetical protein
MSKELIREIKDIDSLTLLSVDEFNEKFKDTVYKLKEGDTLGDYTDIYVYNENTIIGQHVLSDQIREIILKDIARNNNE